MLSEVSDAAVAVVRKAVIACVWDLALFNLGRIALLIATAGRYPRGRFVQDHSDRISATGLAALILIWLGLALYNNHFATGPL